MIPNGAVRPSCWLDNMLVLNSNVDDTDCDNREGTTLYNACSYVGAIASFSLKHSWKTSPLFNRKRIIKSVKNNAAILKKKDEKKIIYIYFF